MKCEDCKYFEGRDRETGEPCCEMAGDCPYEEDGTIAKDDSKIKVEIDLADMETRIKYAFKNSIAGTVNQVVEKLIKAEFETQIRDKTKGLVESMLEKKISEFMEQDIHVGGGWNEPERTITRNQYVSEIIEKKLNGSFEKEALSQKIADEVNYKVSRFTRETTSQINNKISRMFDEATRTSLTDSVVSLLMSNDTYQKLNANMQQLIGGGENV